MNQANRQVDPSNPQTHTIKGQTCYFDMGSFPSWDFVNWTTPPTVNDKKLDPYLNSLFMQLKEANVDQLNLAFSQIGDIDLLLNGGKGVPATDSIGTVLNQYPGMLEKFIDMAHQNGFQVDLSIGGEDGTSMKICSAGETPEGQATKLVKFLNQYQFDHVDFDLEDAGAIEFQKVNTPSSVPQNFFKTLHKQLKKVNKTVSLTIQGSTKTWAHGYLKELFYDQNNTSIFNEMFDGLNLMLYSQTQFYIDIKGDWGIKTWLDVIGKENSKKIHIGFQDGIDYSNLSKSWAPENPNEKCPWSIQPNSTSGSAAAQIFDQLGKHLSAHNYITPLGKPFWWPQRVGSQNRYEPTSSGASKFNPVAEQDFWAKLSQKNLESTFKRDETSIKV